MIFDIGGTKYRIEFQHIIKASKRGRHILNYFTGFRGLTTCVVVTGDLVSIKNVFCSELDNFSKEAGRVKALKKALSENPKIVRGDIPLLIQAYHDRPKKGRKKVGSP